eukprot:SAG31_NODE_47051_length_251_cov_149.677632_1_plen_59_part_10
MVVGPSPVCVLPSERHRNAYGGTEPGLCATVKTPPKCLSGLSQYAHTTVPHSAETTNSR